jgi:hypothetical protein
MIRLGRPTNVPEGQLVRFGGGTGIGALLEDFPTSLVSTICMQEGVSSSGSDQGIRCGW